MQSMTLLAHVAEFPYSAAYRQELAEAGEDVEAVMSAAYDGTFVRDLSAWCAAVLMMDRRHRKLADDLLSGEAHPMEVYDEVDAAVGKALGPFRRNGRLKLNPRRLPPAPVVEVMPPGPRKSRAIDDAAARYAGAPLYEGTEIMEESYNVADELGLSPGSMNHRQWQAVATEAWRRVQSRRLPGRMP
jgi:hypothetical protein